MRQSQFTTPKALRRTIETDVQIYRWFYLLITRPDVRDGLITVNSNKSLYRNLKCFEFCALGLMLIAVILLAGAVASAVYWLLWPALFLAVWSKRCSVEARSAAAKISLSLAERDLGESSLPEMTLYQIGEFLARKYEVEPLLNVITGVNNLIRVLIVGVFLVATVIYPLNFWNTWAAVLAVYILINLLNNTSVAYRHVS